MKNILKSLCGVALVLAVSLSVAQGGGGRGQGGMRMGGMMGMNDASGVMLLSRNDVKKDLGVTADQASKIEAIQTEQREAMRGMFQPGGDMEAMRAAMEKSMTETRTKVLAVLTPEQVKRLKEINVQFQGARIVMVPEVAKELGITEEQKGKIEALQNQMNDANRSLMEKVRSGEIDREEMQPRMQKNNEALTTEINKVLTDAQKAKIKEMSGKAFTRDPNERGGFGGRGGGGGF